MRLIDADNFREEWLINGLNENIYCTNDFLASIDAEDTIDAAPVVHARWIKNCDNNTIQMCSNCSYLQINTGKANFCSNCGAKMDVMED